MANILQTVRPQFPVFGEEIRFHDWKISYEKSHTHKTIRSCPETNANRCVLCRYQQTLELPLLPDMVFHNNKLVLEHNSGAVLEFKPMDSLALVSNGKQPLEVAGAEAGQGQNAFKPFDWTFTSTYQGTMNEDVFIESTDQELNRAKLLEREKIIFYHEIPLFEDRLDDRGISEMGVRIRVMPSGFFILLRHFLRVDGLLIGMHDTRFHYEIGKDFILKEYIHREASGDNLKKSVFFWTKPDEMQNHLPEKSKELNKLWFN